MSKLGRIPVQLVHTNLVFFLHTLWPVHHGDRSIELVACAAKALQRHLGHREHRTRRLFARLL